MTLEQIKKRQEQINGMLYTLLNETEVVVEKIIGEQPKEEEDSLKGYPVSGLLEEITATQNSTESYIEKLSYYSRLLCQGTFATTEVNCSQIKAVR
jgi:hypothetical protein